MPDLQPVPILPDYNFEREKFIQERDALAKAAALKLVRDTFFNYASARQNQEDRWATNDRLYHGYVTKRYWEGTKIERSSLPVMIVYDQVEAAYPILTEALFDYYPTFFDVQALGETHPVEANQARTAISDYMDTPYDLTGLTALSGLSRAVRQAEIYGDGFIELSWDFEQKRFIIEFIDIRDLYLDPRAGSPVIDHGTAVIRRQLIPVSKLIEARGTPGMDIPSDEQLNYLAQRKFHTMSEWLKDEQAAVSIKEFSADVFNTPMVDPSQNKIEVLKYYTKTREIWVFGREHVAVNAKNKLGFFPFCKAPFTEVVGQVYSMGLPDVLEGDQKYVMGLRNARLDNVALSLNPPRTASRATANLTPSQRAWRPGLIETVNNKDEVVIHKIENHTADAFREEQFIIAGSMNRTGVNQLAQSGLPTPSNANRSATGVSQQQSAASRRLRTAVKNFEDYMIVPMLYKIARMIEIHAPEVLELPSGGVVEKSLFSRPMRFKMNAASRMVVRDRLATMLGPVTQIVFNEGVLKQINMQGKTVDMSEFERFLQDATATSQTYRFFRELSEEEKEQMQQPSPEEQLKAQVAQQSNQTRMQMGQMKAQVDMQKAQLQKESADNATGERSATEILKVLEKLMAAVKEAKNGPKSGSKGSGSKPKSK